jgi:hypothetical protein
MAANQSFFFEGIINCSVVIGRILSRSIGRDNYIHSWEMGRWGDGEMGRWGDGEMGI